MVLWIERKRRISFIVFLLVALEIFWISSIPGVKGGAQLPLVAITWHFSAFFLFAFFFFFLLKGNKKITFSHIITTLIVSLIYAISDEFHQSFVPFRSPSVKDVMIDFIGLSFSLLLAVFISKKANQNS